MPDFVEIERFLHLIERGGDAGLANTFMDEEQKLILLAGQHRGPLQASIRRFSQHLRANCREQSRNTANSFYFSSKSASTAWDCHKMTSEHARRSCVSFAEVAETPSEPEKMIMKKLMLRVRRQPSSALRPLPAQPPRLLHMLFAIERVTAGIPASVTIIARISASSCMTTIGAGATGTTTAVIIAGASMTAAVIGATGIWLSF